MQFAWGYAPTLAIEAAVRHGVFDLLDQGPKGVEEIAVGFAAGAGGQAGLSRRLWIGPLANAFESRWSV